MNKIDVKLKIFVLVCFVILLWVGCASASTLVVNQTSPACTKGDEYFTSIQAAVDSANGGDEIVVCPGTYMENIEVSRAVYLHSYAGSTNTIIEAKNVTDDVITVTANNVTISGFTIRNSVGDGIYLDAVEGCNISGNNIYSTRFGIRLFSSSNNIITHNTANLNNNDGIFLESSNDNLIVNNTANSNKQYHGIELYSSKNNVISDNNASNNFQSGISLFESSNNNIIKGNTANSNKQYHGIQLSKSNNNAIIDNNASNNLQDGIRLEGSDDNIIRGNTANSNKQYEGIELRSSNKNAILGNNVSYNLDAGIALFDSNNNNITYNIVIKNHYSGIYLESSLENIIKNNTLKLNIASGINLNSCNSNRASGSMSKHPLIANSIINFAHFPYNFCYNRLKHI